MPTEKIPPPVSPPPSSSDSLPPDPLLERLLGAIARGLDGLNRLGEETRNLHVKQAVSIEEQNKFNQQHARRVETHLADLRTTISDFLSHVRVTHNIETGAIIGAQQALDASKKSFDKAIEESGKFITMTREELTADSIDGKGLHVRWVTVWKVLGVAKAGIPIAVKVAGLLAALAAAAYKTIEGMAPYMKGWH